jgi:hypothetical protein
MQRAIKKSKALFIQKYYVQEEEIGDTGIFQPVHFVRFFYEYIKPGGPLKFDQTLTGCFNDQLLDGEMQLAFREKILVTIQPTPLRWLPALLFLPKWNTQGTFELMRTVSFIFNDLSDQAITWRPLTNSSDGTTKSRSPKRPIWLIGSKMSRASFCKFHSFIPLP